MSRYYLRLNNKQTLSHFTGRYGLIWLLQTHIKTRDNKDTAEKMKVSYSACASVGFLCMLYPQAEDKQEDVFCKDWHLTNFRYKHTTKMLPPLLLLSACCVLMLCGRWCRWVKRCLNSKLHTKNWLVFQDWIPESFGFIFIYFLH